MKIIRSMCVLFSIALLFGCGGRNVEGTFQNVANEKEFIEFKKDGSYFLKVGDKVISGKYTVDGKNIILHSGSKLAARGKIKKDIIIDTDGTTWKKK